MREREREEKIKRKTPNQSVADNVPGVKIYFFIIFLPLITHKRERES